MKVCIASLFLIVLLLFTSACGQNPSSHTPDPTSYIKVSDEPVYAEREKTLAEQEYALLTGNLNDYYDASSNFYLGFNGESIFYMPHGTTAVKEVDIQTKEVSEVCDISTGEGRYPMLTFYSDP